MTKHIGIVACSSEGAALCYRTICNEGAKIMGKYAHPEITLHSHSFSEYMKFLEVNDWQGVAELMLSSAEQIAKTGADFIICPDNTIHKVFDQVVERSPLPWLHIAEVVAVEALRCNYKWLGVLGTSYLMEGPVYTEKLTKFGLRSSI